MSLIIKMTVSLYILSVLAFSSWSRAENTEKSTASKKTFSLTQVNSVGTVFEADGFLYFEGPNGQVSLVHSNNFDLFDGVQLPAKVALVGQNMKLSSFSLQPPVVQISKLTIFRGNSPDLSDNPSSVF